MSYCRWSSDNWRCALYCYEDVAGGFTTHVAANKVVGEIPPEPSLAELRDADDPEKMAEWSKRHRAVMDFLQTAERTPIGLPFDGETFNDPDLPSFLERLLSLRAVGYHFPDYLLDDVREEIAATPAGASHE